MCVFPTLSPFFGHPTMTFVSQRFPKETPASQLSEEHPLRFILSPLSSTFSKSFNWIFQCRTDVAPITSHLRLGLSALSGAMASHPFSIPIPLHGSQLCQCPNR